ncbi:ATP-dependent DNA helicase [Cnuibacter physcomitrellae]|uniref:DNA 3'-5' helicase n=1 Tax=Cnuibacter physcomitrellae TaxID=1619308 RepID=A0A1X9LN31_9MICO|nr:ATP-dependent DNA helicase [Cnuibacter physcomitrellae]ARJ05688.1 ATP-dependent DNA helicase [Cnuibacter physcomitrellae]GGI36264.1 ATP-dependent DNA helicase [Cnuibacter physcomitrellae]
MTDALFDLDDFVEEPTPRVPLSATEIAERLGLPTPTEQQRAVIESPLEPRIVVAGAGSGKTETMAARVVWLVANGHVALSEVLGLTFTRKAAGELAARIQQRVAQLSEHGLGPEIDAFEAPAISTYNAFANTIFRENAVRIGQEGDAQVLSEASAWQLARHVVLTKGDDRLADLEKSPDQITTAVLDLSRAMAENVADGLDVVDYAAELLALRELPTGSARVKAALRSSLVAPFAAVAALEPLVALAEEYAAEKRRRGLIEFSDQVALALRIVETAPVVTEEHRRRYRVVLLDEYQDTSVVQTRLLSRLFGGHPVMAVGDPHQSIYGWRGASAANLGRFANDFGAVDPHPFALSTSWRNPRLVLDAANTIVAPLSAGVAVERLGARPGAAEGSVEVAFAQTVDDEARAVARWFAERMRGAGSPPSAALLCRSVKNVDRFTSALDDAGIPYHVLGLGGLLSEPVVVDLVSTLRVLYHPTAGPELVRLLSGARWRIGPRDLVGLKHVAAWLARRDHRHAPLDDDVRGMLRSSVAEGEAPSLVDALDFVTTAPADYGVLAGISAVGLERMRDAGRTLTALRARTGLALADLVRVVVQELRLDIEVLAGAHPEAGIAALDALEEQISGFTALDPSAGLGAFLAWLQEAEQRDRLAPRSEEAEAGTVQILTIHGAKGLEWDLVAIPRLVEGELPDAPRTKKGWLAFGELPFAFRGDHLELPTFHWRGAEHQGELADALGEFEQQIADRHAEEQRRLAYVAVTRAREQLLLTGAFWSTQKSSRGPSRFLHELREVGVIPADALPDAPDEEENPLADGASRTVWPRDPLGGRRSRVERAAAAVTAADPGAETPWDAEIELLLAERDAAGRAPVLDVPTRIPASRFKDWVTDPEQVAARLARPMPERPYRQTRLGSRFHLWLEARFAAGGGALLDERLVLPGNDVLDAEADELDGAELPGEGSDLLEVDDDRLEELVRIFEGSEFAARSPVEVETEIHLVLEGRILICRLDAVFEEDGRFEVVDWKTGRPPKDDADLELKQLQLSLYRLAYATWRGVPVESVDACFYYVADDVVIRPERLHTEPELRALVSRAFS